MVLVVVVVSDACRCSVRQPRIYSYGPRVTKQLSRKLKWQVKSMNAPAHLLYISFAHIKVKLQQRERGSRIRIKMRLHPFLFLFDNTSTGDESKIIDLPITQGRGKSNNYPLLAGTSIAYSRGQLPAAALSSTSSFGWLHDSKLKPKCTASGV